MLNDFVTEQIRPDTKTGYVQLSAVITTADNTNSWIGSDDFESAYALVFPEIEEEEAE